LAEDFDAVAVDADLLLRLAQAPTAGADAPADAPLSPQAYAALPGALDTIERKIAGHTLRAIPHSVLNHFFHFPADLGSQGKKRGVDFLLNYRRRHLMANFYALRTLWSEDERRNLYSPEFKALASDSWMPRERPLPADRDPARVPFLDRLLRLQYDEWLQDWALIRQDKNTMAHSLEYRLPFLDHRLIELAFRMPPHLKMRRGEDKWIERRLADKVFADMPRNRPGHRPKIPFFLPLEFFFEHPEFRELVADTLSDSQIRARGYFNPAAVRSLLARMESREFLYLKQVMSLVILELWHRAFVDGKGPSS
jgi:asparagine synthase (glutamine-hydrolysing)